MRNSHGSAYTQPLCPVSTGEGTIKCVRVLTPSQRLVVEPPAERYLWSFRGYPVGLAY